MPRPRNENTPNVSESVPKELFEQIKEYIYKYQDARLFGYNSKVLTFAEALKFLLKDNQDLRREKEATNKLIHKKIREGKL